MATSSDELERPRPLVGARLDNQLLEAECLAHGLSTLRLSPVAFLAGPADAGTIPWGFTRSMSAASALVSRRICEDEHQLRQLLHRRGIPTAPAGEGRLARALVVGGQTISIVADTAPGQELVGRAHPSVRDLAGDAVATLPGVPHATVHLRLHDVAMPVVDQGGAVVGVDLNPSLADHRPPALVDGSPVERQVVAQQLRDAGTERVAGSELHLEVLLLGCSDPRRARNLLRGTARRLRLDVTARVRDDVAEAEVAGPTADVALLPAVVARRARRVHDVVRTRVLLGGDR